MHVLFVAPHFPSGQRHFVRALHSVGARVTGIGESAPEHMDHELKSWLYGYERVSSVVDEDAMYAAVRRAQQREWVDRLEATIEAHILPTARVRERCTIPGLTVRAAVLCRDKPEMKEVVRAAGIPCAQSTAVSTVAEAHDFARSVGFPLILKPRAAAGAQGTVRVDDQDELDAGLHELGVGRGASIAVEEFVTGHEGFYDTLAVGGEVKHEFISHYYPNVLEAMRTRWISPQIVVTNRVDADGYSELKDMGQRVI
jgi:phosphoribosylaminoimidazole carboxylase (NCAIR synthetase)